MASTMSSPSTTPLIVLPNSSMLRSPFLPKTPQRSIFQNKKPLATFASKTLISCKANNNANGFDRRDVLLGLGGLYGATNLIGDPFASASPIEPDLEKCGDSIVVSKDKRLTVPCCPPISTKIMDFVLPKGVEIRSRPAAHLVESSYLKKFELAMERMRALPDNDPRSFKQQAKIHCAYCNEGYPQLRAPLDVPDQKLKVHSSWIFFPFHRMYLYFFERILGSLVDDPDFRIPFWNWDSPDGMTIPEMYLPSTSPLYDALRNENHVLPSSLVDLDYDSKKEKIGADADESYRRQLIKNNLSTMHREMVKNRKPSLFLGTKYVSGCRNASDPGCEPEKGPGSLEAGSHTAIHKWVGNPDQTFKQDMGNFYSAGNDPLFYAHHGNVDRMWSIWKTLPGRKPGKKRSDFDDNDWLDSTFYFYDENKNLVRCKVGQFVDTKKLGYDYQSVDIPWLETKSTPRRSNLGLGQGRRRRRGQEKEDNTVYTVSFAGKPVRIEVPRPKKPTTKFGEEEKEEALLIEDIKLDQNDSIKFDVCINDDDDGCTPQDSEYAGTFTNIPHGEDSSMAMPLKTNLTLPISDLLEDLKCTEDDSITVTLVPREGEVTVDNIKIIYV